MEEVEEESNHKENIKLKPKRNQLFLILQEISKLRQIREKELQMKEDNKSKVEEFRNQILDTEKK